MSEIPSRPRARYGPRDPLLRYLRPTRSGKWYVRIPLDSATGRVRLGLGVYPTPGAARLAIQLFERLLEAHKGDPFAARAALGERLGRGFLPQRVRRRCRRCAATRSRRCDCKEQRRPVEWEYVAVVRVPGASARLGPFASAAQAEQAARKQLLTALGDQAALYLPSSADIRTTRSRRAAWASAWR